MIIRDVQLETVCGVTSTLPENKLAEIAFAGKSNVGKSSLINALVNRRSLARTSAQPGKTQTINFYRVDALRRVKQENDGGATRTGALEAAAGAADTPVGSQADAADTAARPQTGTADVAGVSSSAGSVSDTYYKLYLVDLPGYGYARASQKAKVEWGRLIERYLHTSKQLKTVFLLIDIRHEPGANDVEMYDWIVSRGYQPVIIATKMDKIKRSQVTKQLALIRKKLQVKPGTVMIPFSAQTKQGREEIWDYMTAHTV